jgi:hypothetical protein
MPLPRRGRLRLAALAWVFGLLAATAALERGGPLFLNLGAGDAAFARGFRGGWERDGLRQAGETTFRWTLDGSRLEAPVVVLTGSPRARLRLARFAPGSAEVAVVAASGERDRWTQPSQGWRVREVDLGEWRGPLVLTFRSQSADAEGLGVALDWVEVTGAGLIVPQTRMIPGLAIFIIGIPVLIGLIVQSASVGFVTGGIVLAMTATAIGTDRLGGLVAVSRAGLPCLIALATTGVVARALARAWPESFDKDGARAAVIGARATVIPATTVVVALLALAHPFYYYPDVDTHARYLAASRADPGLLLDPTDYQARTGAWTREVGGRRVAFPYSPAFHVLAWPVALLLGEELAVKCAAAAALGTTVLLVYGLARALGFGARAAILAQALLVLLPVTASRLVLALYPTLLAQTLELLLVVGLARAFANEGGRRSAWAFGLLLAACQAAYTGSLFTVALLVTTFALLEGMAGQRRRALALVGLYVVTAVVVVLLQYARFLPVFWRDVVPHLGDTAAASAPQGGGGVLPQALRRAALFYDAVYPLLLVPGLLAARGAPGPARRAVAAALLAGLALLVLRYAVPVVFRDAKEVELLAGPVAALAAGGVAWLWRRGPAPRAAALVALLVAAAWGASRAALAYAERFVAVGR